MKSVLFISVAFPPKNDPECLQTAKYFKYLKANDGLSISVVTSSIPTLFMPYDKALHGYDKGYAQKVDIKIFESKITNFALRKILANGIDFPDSKFSFHLQHRKVIRQLKQTPDVIYSRSYPLSSALMAYKLKCHYRVPWVMHLSDPWVDSPIHVFNSVQKNFHAAWEMKCFEKADRVSFTSQKSVEFYTEKYPKFSNKFVHFPNVFDLADERFVELDFSRKLSVVYTGGLAGDRSPLPVIRGLEAFNAQYPDLIDELEVIFAGPVDRRNRELFEHCTLPNLKKLGELSYREALALQQKAGILLSIDQPLADNRLSMFFPSKLLDYFLTRRTIMALTNRGSATDQILKSLHSQIFYYDDMKPMEHFFKAAVMAFKSRDKSFFEMPTLPSAYDAKMNADRLAELLLAI